MNIRGKALLSGFLLVALGLFAPKVYATDSFITNGRSILAFGEEDAYLINTSGDLCKWDPAALKWQLFTIGTPSIRQMDCFTDGSKVVGTDLDSHVQEWNGTFGFGSVWTQPQGNTPYNWVLHDPISQETRGQRTGLNDAWVSFETPTLGGGDPWNKFLPANPGGTKKITPLFLIDRDTEKFHRWQRGDVGYFVTLNLSGGTDPFHIFYFGGNEAAALARITDPPLVTHNIDDIFVRQISYDEVHQNLWCLNENGVPYRWHNRAQEWILSNIKGDEGFEPIPPPPGPTAAELLFKIQDDWYVRTTYIKGEFKPVLIVFKDTMIMHLILGERGRSELSSIQIVIFEEKFPDHKFHTLLLLPRQTPQKKVILNGGVRTRENHYLERLLINNGIIPNEFAISLFPAEHRLIRR